MAPITKAQLRILQTVCGQLANREVGMENTREARLAWASKLCRRDVKSFSALTLSEANHLIDQVNGELGIAPKKKRLDAKSARRAGLDGRRNDEEFRDQPELVHADDIAVIRSFYQRLGLTEKQFDGWMRSKRGPLKGRAEIRTKADANRVWWALKGRLQAKGLWEERATA